jgi:protein TonB
MAVAVADTARSGRSASDAPPAFAPGGATAGKPAEAVPTAELPAPASPAGVPASPAPASPAGVLVSPAGAPPEQVAALAPAVRPQSGPVELRARRHDPPQFPARALRTRVLEGYVMARIWITAEGSVEQVDIVKATPARVFDDEVKRALSSWTFDPPGHPVDTTVELTFKP